MSEARYSVEFVRRAPPGSMKRFLRVVVWNAAGEPVLLEEPLARKIARQMAGSTQIGARVLEGRREVVRYLWREGEVEEQEGAP